MMEGCLNVVDKMMKKDLGTDFDFSGIASIVNDLKLLGDPTTVRGVIMYEVERIGITTCALPWRLCETCIELCVGGRIVVCTDKHSVLAVSIY
jgi:hypothetical protein